MKTLAPLIILFSSIALLCQVRSDGTVQKKASQGSQLRAALKDPSDKAWKEPAPAVFRVKFETAKGEFVIEAQRQWSPLGVDRFYHLTRTGFFDDSRFFRIRANYIAQFGIAGDP